MLNRERIALSVLEHAGGPLSKTAFVKLMFLLRKETELEWFSAFYDFVPYKYGPFSFALYRDMQRLETYGYIATGEDHVALNMKLMDETQGQTRKLAKNMQLAVHDVLERYGHMDTRSLIETVYRLYPWYATKSECPERHLVSLPAKKNRLPAVYTAGYEGKSVDAFFAHLLAEGIEAVIDVRANPISRKYGFSGRRMKQISEGLGIKYLPFPSLGISSGERTNLSDYGSYARLFTHYETHILSHRAQEIKEVGDIMLRQPSTLVCVEKDAAFCHRGRLSRAIAKETGMEELHL